MEMVYWARWAGRISMIQGENTKRTRCNEVYKSPGIPILIDRGNRNCDEEHMSCMLATGFVIVNIELIVVIDFPFSKVFSLAKFPLIASHSATSSHSSTITTN